MKKSEIKIGGYYLAKINGRLVTVQVDRVNETTKTRNGKIYFGDHYDVTNLATGRKVTFRSAARFRSEVGVPKEPAGTRQLVKCEGDLQDGRGPAVQTLLGATYPEAEEQANQETTGESDSSGRVKANPTGAGATNPASEVGVTATGATERGYGSETGQSQISLTKEDEQCSDPTPSVRPAASKSESRQPRSATTASSGAAELAPSSAALTEEAEAGVNEITSPSSPAVAGTKPAGPQRMTDDEIKRLADYVFGPERWCEDTEPDCCESAPGDNCCVGCGLPVRPAPPASLASKVKDDAAPHLIVEARAGVGKTTTLIEGLKYIKGLSVSITPSPQQEAIWEAMAAGPAPKTVCFVAFNKAIATELQRRVPPGCDAMTMHSMGFRAVQKALGRQEPNSYVVQDIIAELLNRDIRWLRANKPVVLKATEKLVGLCKMNLVGGHGTPADAGKRKVTLHPVTGPNSMTVVNVEDPIITREDAEFLWETALDQLASHYDVDLNGSRAEVFALVPRVLERCKTPQGKITFDDMVYLPVVLNLPVFQYDLLLVDECQDLNRCQQALAKRAGKRLVLCGDPKQAIYGFAGADAESMPRMARELGITIECDAYPGQPTRWTDHCGCIILPLTVTRRCGKVIVKEAQKIVPDFEAHESCPEGKVSYASYCGGRPGPQSYHERVMDGDFILCRCNAPLVSQCFQFLKAGRKANIQGRDIGQGLISTVRKLALIKLASDPGAENWCSVPELVGKLSDWLHQETAKEQAKRNPSEARLIALKDRHDCLVCFTDEARTVRDVIVKIESIFTDDKVNPGIRLSSVHKAKGLEADRVFLLQPKGAEVMHPMAKSEWGKEQNRNLLYVAITRAKTELVYVS